MKKKLVLITIIITIATSIFGLNYYRSKTKIVNSFSTLQINTYENSKNIFTINNTDLLYKVLCDSINKSVTYTKPIKYNKEIIFEFIDKNKTKKNLNFYSDIDKKELYFLYNNKQYIIPREYSKLLLNYDEFSDLYPNNINPSIIIHSAKSSIVPHSAKSNLFYKKINSKWYKISNINTSTNLDSNIIMDPVLNLIESENLKINISPKPSHFEVYTNNEQQKLNENIYIPLKIESTINYTIKAIWEKNTDSDFYGEKDWTFKVNVDLKPKLEVINSTEKQGDFFIIKMLNLNYNETPILEQNIIDNIKYWKIDDAWYSIIPLNYWVKKGTYKVKFSIKKNNNVIPISNKTLDILNKKFDKQYLTIDKTVASSTKNPEAYSQYAKIFSPSREKSINKKLWQGKFIWPCVGRISTEFGMMRYVNGTLTSYRHSGIDIAVPRGTPVLATNSGKIVLSQKLIMTGNTVVIDHGLGIFSVYFHMDSLNYNKNEMVKKGEIIGTVGTTGFSTGPHLHFTTSYYKTNLDPNTFLNWDGKL
ncbi:M23 family metallopeptidase [Helicovermis profundi]|uniref:M23ase beta-sheet core domain-containing protein n=1 Tax=Helicovermis profundi TaxID=3065157 RepID=A0AAU9E829_9FIRM|nr:hypothetical protein HLPR_19240 [Clostridia bacterium S502]